MYKIVGLLLAFFWVVTLGSCAAVMASPDPIGIKHAADTDASARIQVAAYNAQAQTAIAQANAQAAIQSAAYNAQVSIAWAAILPIVAVLVLAALLIAGAMALGFLLLAGRGRRPAPVTVTYDPRFLHPPAGFAALPPPADRWDDCALPAVVPVPRQAAAGRGIQWIE